MRAVAKAGTVSRSVRRATQPATPPSDVQTTGPQGTTGGRAAPIRKQAARQQLRMGQHIYLWILVAIELVITGIARRYFRQFHGG